MNPTLPNSPSPLQVVLTKIGATLRSDASELSGRDVSRTINFSRITLIVGLVFLHYGEWSTRQSDIEIAAFINNFVRYFFFAAVPLLSVISGWLFFSFSSNPEQALVERIRRRFRSVYLPLVFWNALFLAVLGALYWLDPSQVIFREINIDFGTAGPLQYLNAVFAITDHPVGFQFWFVRDLFVTILISPLLWILLRFAPLAGLVCLFGVWALGQDLGIFFRSDVLFFFYVGGLLRLSKSRLDIGWKSACSLLAVYCALVAARAYADHFVDQAVGWREFALDTATRCSRVIGVLAVWGLFIRIAKGRFGETVARLGSFAFFLYCAHFPMMAGIKIVLWRMVPEWTDGWMLTHYFLTVLLTTICGVGGGMFLAWLRPRWFALLNGGRLAFENEEKISRIALQTERQPAA
jgi:surface polysaccharide O-acyltransferase-like enzyme